MGYMKKNDIIGEYVDIIVDNLPQWNHKEAKSNQDIQKQKIDFIHKATKIDTTLHHNEQLKALAELIKTDIPDAHINILDTDDTMLLGMIRPSYRMQQDNICFVYENEHKKLNFKKVTFFSVNEKAKPWMISTLKTKNKNIGVVAISTLSGDMTEQAKKRSLFVDRLFNEKKRNKWDDIIFDLRGVPGGDAEFFKEIGERLGGKPLSYSDKLEVIEPKVKNSEHAEIMKNKFHATDYKSYTHLCEEVFSGKICILQNKWNCSAAEGAIYMMSQLPNTITIGDSTMGMFSGGSCVMLPMSAGKLVIGTEYRERTKNGNPIKEKEGAPPDIKCDTMDAFQIAINTVCKFQNTFSKLASDMKNDKDNSISTLTLTSKHKE